MMVKNVIFWTPSEIHWGPKWHPKSHFFQKMFKLSNLRAPPGPARIHQIQYKSLSGWHFAVLTFFCFALVRHFSYFLKKSVRKNTLNAILQIPRETSSRWDLRTFYAQFKNFQNPVFFTNLTSGTSVLSFFSAQDRLQDVASICRRFG
jgi:hypothetical protein